MLLEVILGYKSTWRIMGLLAEAPTKSLTRQEIKEQTKLGNSAITSALNRLTLTEILIKRKTLDGRQGYHLNTGNVFTGHILNMIIEEKKSLLKKRG